jgi:hypothetical protein
MYTSEEDEGNVSDRPKLANADYYQRPLSVTLLRLRGNLICRHIRGVEAMKHARVACCLSALGCHKAIFRTSISSPMTSLNDNDIFQLLVAERVPFSRWRVTPRYTKIPPARHHLINTAVSVELRGQS